MKFVIDEDLPKSTTRELLVAGFEVFDVREVGLKSGEDEEIFKFVKEKRAILISADLGFANIIRFTITADCGVIVLRYPNEVSNDRINHELLRTIKELSDQEMYGHLLIVEPGRTRIHKAI